MLISVITRYFLTIGKKDLILFDFFIFAACLCVVGATSPPMCRVNSTVLVRRTCWNVTAAGVEIMDTDHAH